MTAQKDDPALGWVISQLVSPVHDPAGFLAGHEVQLEEEAKSDRGTALIVLDAERRVPLLRDEIPGLLEDYRRVVIVATGWGITSLVRPDDVLELAAEEGLAVGALRYFESGWGLTLVQGNVPHQGWESVALDAVARSTTLEGDIRRLREETTEFRRQLTESIDQQRRLLVEMDEAATRGADLEDELRRLRQVEGARVALEARLRTVTQERDISQERQGQLEAAVADLQNQLERMRSQPSRRELELERRQAKLLRDREVLRNRLAVEKWKRERMMNRRWWLLGRLMSDLARRPLSMRNHVAVFRQLLSPPTAVERPQPHDVVAAQVTEREYSPRADSAELIATSPAPVPRAVSDPRDLVVAAILDEMSHAAFAPECALVSFTPFNWKGVLESANPDLLLVESAWKGNEGSWEYQVGSYSHPDSLGLPHLTELVEWCRQRGIPTVFWNKEDPVHFGKFQEAAVLFDVIFTTDIEQLPAYRRLDRVRANRLASLPFAAQPALHYPAPLEGRIQHPVFAGTFYRNRHPERRQQLEMLLDGALDRGLIIYDRMGGEVSDSFGYPERFSSAIVGGVPYTEMVEVYRRHRVFLNTNSVVDSPTMFSRRVFELLACGTPVVSTVSRGVTDMFGGEVAVVRSADEVRKEVDRLLDDTDYWMDVSGRGVRAVARRHLYADRLRTIAEAAGFDLKPLRQVRRIQPNTALSDELLEEEYSYAVYGTDEGLAWFGRIVAADIIGYASDPSKAYTWTDEIPAGDLAVSRSLLQNNWSPDLPMPQGAGIYLIPQ